MVALSKLSERWRNDSQYPNFSLTEKESYSLSTKKFYVGDKVVLETSNGPTLEYKYSTTCTTTYDRRTCDSLKLLLSNLLSLVGSLRIVAAGKILKCV